MSKTQGEVDRERFDAWMDSLPADNIYPRAFDIWRAAVADERSR